MATLTSQSTSGPFKVTHFAKVTLECTTCHSPIAVGEKFYRYTETGGRLYGDRFVRRECAACIEKRNELWVRVEAQRKAQADEQAERAAEALS
jgi:hypothetical protein